MRGKTSDNEKNDIIIIAVNGISALNDVSCIDMTPI